MPGGGHCGRGRYSFFLVFQMLGIVVAGNPAAGVDKGGEPWGYLVGEALCLGIVGALPGEDGALEVGHHGQMASVGRCDARNAQRRTVGVGGIGAIVVLCHHIVAVNAFGQIELALTMGYPDAQFRAGK